MKHLTLIVATLLLSVLLSLVIAQQSTLVINPSLPREGSENNSILIDFTGVLITYVAHEDSEQTWLEFHTTPTTEVQPSQLTAIRFSMFTRNGYSPDSPSSSVLFSRSFAPNTRYSLGDLIGNAEYKVSADEKLFITGHFEFTLKSDEIQTEFNTFTTYGQITPEGEEKPFTILTSVPASEKDSWLFTSNTTAVFIEHSSSSVRSILELTVPDITVNTRKIIIAPQDFLTLSIEDKAECFINGLATDFAFEPVTQTITLELSHNVAFIPKNADFHMDCYGINAAIFGSEQTIYSNYIYATVEEYQPIDRTSGKMHATFTKLNHITKEHAVVVPDLFGVDIVTDIVPSSIDSPIMKAMVSTAFFISYEAGQSPLILSNASFPAIDLMLLPKNIAVESITVVVSVPLTDEVVRSSLHTLILSQDTIEKKDIIMNITHPLFSTVTFGVSPQLNETLFQKYASPYVPHQLILDVTYILASKDGSPLSLPFQMAPVAMIKYQTSEGFETEASITSLPPRSLIDKSHAQISVKAKSSFTSQEYHDSIKDDAQITSNLNAKYKLVMSIPHVSEPALHGFTLYFPQKDFVFIGNFTCQLAESDIDGQNPLEHHITALDVTPNTVTNMLHFSENFRQNKSYTLTCPQTFITFNQYALNTALSLDHEQNHHLTPPSAVLVLHTDLQFGFNAAHAITLDLKVPVKKHTKWPLSILLFFFVALTVFFLSFALYARIKHSKDTPLFIEGPEYAEIQ